jgi:hypothetical protein
MRRLAIGVLLVTVLASGWACAQTESGLKFCAAIANATARLNCYDALGRTRSPQSAAHEQSKECTVSAAQYQQLQAGISYSDAIQILGCNGVEMSQSAVAGYVTVMYMWKGAMVGGNMNAMFQNGRLITKSQFGLK